MKKLNNHGFAISTVLYSLLIMIFLVIVLMLSIMSSTRNNSKEFVKNIEEDLNRYSLTETIYLPSGNGTAEEQLFFVPEGKSGWYKIELWGASGGDKNEKGGKGAYTTGIVYLKANDRIYFYVGTQGNTRSGGENGGGSGSGNGTGGGGATDVRLTPGTWNDPSSLNSRVMVAAGGGGATDSTEGGMGNALFGYTVSTDSEGKPGSQTAGGQGVNSSNNGSLGLGGNGIGNGSGGGSGYFGGSGGNSNAGGGGSSYISGYSKTEAKALKVQDGKIYENTNSGNGQAKISLIKETSDSIFPFVNTNTNLNNIRYIKDCVEKTGLGKNNEPQWIDIEVISNYTDVVNKNRITDTTDGIRKCKIIDLGQQYNLDSISIWHFDNNEKNIQNRILYNHTLEVAGGNNIYHRVIDIPDGGLSIPEDLSGMRINKWTHDASKNKDLPDGTYYISSALNPNKSLLTAGNNTTNDINGDHKIDYYDNLERDIYLNQINGTDFQKWIFIKKQIDGKNYYEIHEKETYQPLYIENEYGEVNTNVITKVTDDMTLSFIKWDVTSLGDGTYQISSVNQPFDFGKDYYTALATYINSYGVDTGTIILRNRLEVNNTVNRFYITNAYK